MKPIHRRLYLPMLTITAIVLGCETNDERLVEVAREASQRQADQNREIARQNRELAEASKELIKADAESRRELVALERDLQAERSVIGRQRDDLEQERRAIAQERYWDSQAGSAVGAAAVLLAAVLPLALCWLLLRGLWADKDDAVSEILIEELVNRPSPDSAYALEGQWSGELPSPHSDESEEPDDGSA
jgi:hypothetical protein